VLKAVSVFARPQAVTAAHFKTENAVREGRGGQKVLNFSCLLVRGHVGVG